MREKTVPETRGTGTPVPPPLDEWEQGWQSFWKKASFTPYELPASTRDAAHRETQFLMTARTPERELERLKRIQAEFVRGFKGLHALGPAVTVFGSARFKEDHPYYALRGPSARSWPGPASPR